MVMKQQHEEGKLLIIIPGTWVITQIYHRSYFLALLPAELNFQKSISFDKLGDGDKLISVQQGNKIKSQLES